MVDGSAGYNRIGFFNLLMIIFFVVSYIVKGTRTNMAACKRLYILYTALINVVYYYLTNNTYYSCATTKFRSKPSALHLYVFISLCLLCTTHPVNSIICSMTNNQEED